jgi:hypothetical protein
MGNLFVMPVELKPGQLIGFAVFAVAAVILAKKLPVVGKML